MLFGKPSRDEGDAPLSRRQRRAEALRREALSPLRILMMVLALPLTTALIGVGVYMRVSDYERDEAVVHLIALAGCDATEAFRLGPFRRGQPGYHKRNDPDGDGLACERYEPALVNHSAPQRGEGARARMVGSAKFVRP